MNIVFSSLSWFFQLLLPVFSDIMKHACQYNFLERVVIVRTMIAAALLMPILTACSGSEGGNQATHTIAFAAKVGDETFDCAKAYEGIGTAKTKVEAHDFRFYIHDVKLITKDGAEVAADLVQDNKWQYQNVALLDFANDEGTCDSGSPETNTSVRLIAPLQEYAGIHFNFGVPADKNHANAATAPAPLNHPGLWWNWKGGYKYARIDLKTPVNDPYYFHMGGTSCGEKEDGSYQCDLYNVPTIKLQDFDVTSDAVVFRLDKLYEGVDLDVKPEGEGSVAGCMAFPGSEACKPVFKHLGLTFGSAEPGPEQTVFEVGSVKGDGA